MQSVMIGHRLLKSKMFSSYVTRVWFYIFFYILVAYSEVCGTTGHSGKSSCPRCCATGITIADIRDHLVRHNRLSFEKNNVFFPGIFYIFLGLPHSPWTWHCSSNANQLYSKTLVYYKDC